MKKVITSKSAPPAIGPYSQAISVEAGSRIIYFSGAIALDPATGQLVSGGVEKETKQVMANIEGLLKEVGATFENVVKSTIFLKDIADFTTVNQIYGGYFRKDPPARSTVEVSHLPRNAKVEIEVIVAL
ncbi:MAG TPA: Rid family detoxifying hydrolase [Bdellovibrionota bacterium]|jgi:2-iminobutanoate/2-iminopropanoate deaminase